MSSVMNIPAIDEAESLLQEADTMNPGPWIGHSIITAFCARKIAEHCFDLNADTTYVFGLLHDIGRRFGVTDMKHIIDGYRFMKSLGYEDCARICLTHSFPYKDIRSYNGQNDCTAEETEYITAYLKHTDYDDYDRLIQLCDALALSDGATYIEKRLVDVVLRRGFNDLTIPKWKSFLELKDYFDEKAGKDIYKIIGV